MKDNKPTKNALTRKLKSIKKTIEMVMMVDPFIVYKFLNNLLKETKVQILSDLVSSSDIKKVVGRFTDTDEMIVKIMHLIGG